MKIESLTYHILFLNSNMVSDSFKIYVHDLVQKFEYIDENNKQDIFDILEIAFYELYDHTKDLTIEQQNKYKTYFRKYTHKYFLQAAIVSRAFYKPLGYAGDYETMRMCYENKYEGTSLLGKTIHKYYIKNTNVGNCVRNRRIMMLMLIRKYKKTNILSVACGPAFEVKRILQDNRLCTISLLDQDINALNVAKEKIGENPNVNYLHMNIKSLLKNPDIGTYDFIYSMGLFDYLNDIIAKRLCKALYDILNPGGILVIGNVDTNVSHIIDKLILNYLCEWHLIYRNQEQMAALVPYNAKYHIIYETSRTQMFLIIEKVSSKL